jgi:hypothetical protein
MKKIALALILTAMVCATAFAQPSYDEGIHGGTFSGEEEAARLRAAEEADAARAAAEAAAAEAALRQAAAEAASDEAVRQQAAADEAGRLRSAADEEARLAAEEAARRQAAAEAASEEAARQRSAEDEEARLAAEEARQKALLEAVAASEEAARQRFAAEEAARRQAAADEAARLAANEAVARQKAADEAAAAAARQQTAAYTAVTAQAAAADAAAAAQAAAAEAEKAVAEAIARQRAAAWPPGFSVKIDIDTNLGKYTKTDFKNDEYIGDAPIQDDTLYNVAANPNYDDTEIGIAYDDPDGRYGGKIVFAFEELLKPQLLLGDVYAWGKIGFFRERLGKYTYRVVDKVGGDKDLGVMIFSVDKNDISIGSSDSLGLGSDVFGSLSSLIIGRFFEAGFFLSPNEYQNAKQYTPGGVYLADKETVASYYTYKAGGNLKFSWPDIFSIGAAYRQAHLIGTATTTGTIQTDYGVYGILYAIPGISLGLGYSNRSSEDNDDPAVKFFPTYHAFHLDLKVTGIKRFGFAVYNNVSMSALEKEKTLSYNDLIASVGDVFDEESTFVLYNQADVSFDFTSHVTLSLMVRNYYATLTALYGLKGNDYGKDTFITELKLSYKFDEHASLRGGVKFENTTYSTPVNSVVLKNSNYVIAIPVGVTLQW